MKSTVAIVFLVVCSPVHGSQTNPVAKVLDMLTGLQAKIGSEGETAEKAFAEYSSWCEDTSKNLQFDIKTGKSEVEELQAGIAEEVAVTQKLNAKVDELTESSASSEADLKAATAVRAKEAKDFAGADAELNEVLDTLTRAVGILQKEMSSGGASMLQSSGSVVQALSALVEASALSSADAERLTSLVQSSQSSEDGDETLGAPAGAVYESHSGSIVDTVQDLHDKAADQQEEARKKETTSKHNFQLLKQSLEDQIKFATKDADAAKKGIAESMEKKSTLEGDLDVTSKNLAEDKKAFEELTHTCMTKAQDVEAEKKSRAEELAALAKAKEVISEATGGAATQTYGLNQVAFLQMKRSQTESSSFNAVRFVRELSHKHPALAQLASRMETVMRVGSETGGDVFAKVKGLISDMLEKLQSEAEADATQKAFCDKEMAESKAKEDERKTDVEKISTKIDQMTARSAKLKEQVAALQEALANLAKTTAEMDALRQKEKAAYEENRPEMEQGLEGIKTALKILRDYYAQDKDHEAADGAATGIVGLLEVCESDFSKGLAEMVAEEESAVAAYEEETKENAVEKASKTKDVEYKQKEAVSLDKAVTEASSDRASVQAELDAVTEYLKKLDEQCIAKPETYEERVKRREAELAGLNEALSILDGASFVQVSSHSEIEQDPCAGCTSDSAQAYQTCAMVHGDPCAERNAEGLVSSAPGTKKDVGCCLKKEKHNRCMQCKSMDCAFKTCNVNKKYYSEHSDI